MTFSVIKRWPPWSLYTPLRPGCATFCCFVLLCPLLLLHLATFILAVWFLQFTVGAAPCHIPLQGITLPTVQQNCCTVGTNHSPSPLYSHFLPTVNCKNSALSSSRQNIPPIKYTHSLHEPSTFVHARLRLLG